MCPNIACPNIACLNIACLNIACLGPVIGIDANVLIQYLTRDNPIHSARATRLIENDLTAREPGLISVVAMVETAWVLDRAYGLTDREIAAAIELVLQADMLVVESEQPIFTSMIAVRGDGVRSLLSSLVNSVPRPAVRT